MEASINDGAEEEAADMAGDVDPEADAVAAAPERDVDPARRTELAQLAAGISIVGPQRTGGYTYSFVRNPGSYEI